jgi:hypothetical protein
MTEVVVMEAEWHEELEKHKKIGHSQSMSTTSPVL